MGTTTYYTFYDRAVMDPVWRTPWREFFRQHPRCRAKVMEVVKFCFEPVHSEGVEASDEELAEIVERRTLAWTIRRSTGQFFMMSEIMAFVPDLRRHVVEISTRYTEDCFALVAAALDGRVRGQVNDPTLRAVLKLHHFGEPAAWLDLPRRLATEAKRLVPPDMLFKPMYGWQGPAACQYYPFGFTDYEGDNCLGPADTGRFLTFLQRAWEGNWPVPYLRSETGLGMSVEPAAGTAVRFRDVDLAQRLVAKMKVVRRFGELGLFRFLT